MTIKDRLMDEIDTIIKTNQLSGRPNRSINSNNLKTAIIKACDIKYIDYSRNQNMQNYTYGIYDEDTKCYIRKDSHLSYLIELMISNIQPEPNITTHTAKTTIDLGIMSSGDKIEKANLPSSELIKFNNCVYNLKTKESFELDSDEIVKFDFINSIQYDLKCLDKVNNEKLQIVKQIFNTWSKDDEDILKVLKQLVFAAIEGNGRDVQIILKSEGGDGKSTFLMILENLVSEDLIVHINLDEYDDDNILNKIQPSSKLMIGDDLQSNFTMSNKILPRFKSITSGGSISVSEKYMPNKLVSCKGLKIQATNTDLKFFENNPAIKDRVVYLNWPHHNFRQNPIEDFNLDDLVGKFGQPNKEFMEALLSYIIFTTDYFEKFDITNKMKDDFQTVLNDSDTILQHYEELKELGVFNYSHIPALVIYEHYKHWLKIINPGSKPMHQRSYTKKISELLEKEGYTDSKMLPLKRLDSNQFDINIFDNLSCDESIRSKVFINPNLDILQYKESIANDITILSKNQFESKYDERIIRSYLNYFKTEEPSTLLDMITPYKVTELDELSYEEIYNSILVYMQER